MDLNGFELVFNGFSMEFHMSSINPRRPRDASQTSPRRLPDVSQTSPRRPPDVSQASPRRLPGVSQASPRRLPGVSQTSPMRLADVSQTFRRRFPDLPQTIPKRLQSGGSGRTIRMGRDEPHMSTPKALAPSSNQQSFPLLILTDMEQF